MNQLSNKII